MICSSAVFFQVSLVAAIRTGGRSGAALSGPDAYPTDRIRHRSGTIQRCVPVPQGHGISVAHGIDEVLAAGETGRRLTSGMSHQFSHGLSDLGLAPIHDADLGTVAKCFSWS